MHEVIQAAEKYMEAEYFKLIEANEPTPELLANLYNAVERYKQLQGETK